ncbi:MAG: alginate lyase family protein, partial [Candidatus Bathyarchaeia archaeon]
MHVRERCDSILDGEIKVFAPKLWNPTLSTYRSWSVTLAIGYAISGEEKYARKATDILRAMFEVQNTYGRIDPETIHIGYATHTFLLAYDVIQSSGVLDEEDIRQAKEFFKELGGQLRDAIFRHRGNWAMCEATGLVQIALYFPEFVQSEEWLDAGRGRMEELMLIDFADDGGELELAPNYVQLCCYMVGIFAEVMRRFEGVDYYRIIFGQKTIQDMFRWLLYMMTPGGLMPAIHDSGRGVWNIGIFELGAARYRDGVLKFAARKSFDWARRAEEIGLGSYMPGGFEYALIWADETVEFVEPSETTILLYASGFAVFRTSWDLDAHYLVYKYGPFGIGHQHYDKHSVEIWAYGSPLVLDAGTMHYGDPRHRSWDIQTISHNTVMVGLASQRPCDGYLNFFEDLPTFSFVSASAETYRGIAHTRTIVFDKLLGYYLFIDELRSDRENLYTWLWHVRGYTEFPVKPPRISWKTPEGVGLSLICSNPEQLDVEFGSGPSSGFGSIPYVTLQTQGEDVTFVALVVPYADSKPHAQISSSLSESGLTVEVQMRNRTVIYLVPYMENDVVRVQDLEAKAKLAFAEKMGEVISRFGAVIASSLQVHNLTLFRS